MQNISYDYCENNQNYDKQENLPLVRNIGKKEQTSDQSIILVHVIANELSVY